jgi:predicted RNase H-like nuclease
MTMLAGYPTFDDVWIAALAEELGTAAPSGHSWFDFKQSQMRGYEMADRFVAGVDGCRGGWIVVVRPLSSASAARAQLLPAFEDVLKFFADTDAVCVDMPIGLPDLKCTGGRTADVEARRILGRRKASVFSVPSRLAVMQSTYAKACKVARETSTPPCAVAQQCFHLFPKIREIDVLMSPDLQNRVYETHPEVSFWALNGGVPLELPKKAQSGLELRRRLLVAAGYDRNFLLDTSAFPRRQVGPDDLLDAAACAWSAARIVKGTARRFPDVPPLDSKGLRMEIWG